MWLEEDDRLGSDAEVEGLLHLIRWRRRMPRGDV
jgi:hypothetical protein